MSGDVELKMDPDGRRRSPMSASGGRGSGQGSMGQARAGVGKAEPGEEERGLHGGAGALRSAGWGRGI